MMTKKENGVEAEIVYFPVGNGDMTLIKTSSGKRVLIDCYIRGGDEHPDVLDMLKQELDKDSNDRHFIDLFIWSHPDKDHCGGIDKHFHLGPPENYSKDKDLIFINEIWSSPIVYRRASNNKNDDDSHNLCEDAQALNKEVKRRVNLYKNSKKMGVGNYVLILGDDEGDKTTHIQDIVVKLDQTIDKINGLSTIDFEGVLLAPIPESDLDKVCPPDKNNTNNSKNNSSVVFNFTISSDNNSLNFLSGGDAEVCCWEALSDRLEENGNKESLNYDVLQTPHHCSWHSLSHDSLSANKKGAEVSTKAISALNNANTGAYIIASSKSIKDDDNDPPAFKAMQEYKKITDSVDGSFKCVDDNKVNGENRPLRLRLTNQSLMFVSLNSFAKSNATSEAVNRRGGHGYA